ncbi:MAG: SDR family NAD(P)-dependent oxidoreductase [Pseudomonadota bacterium]
MPKRLEGRVALVTGASRGIGAAVAKRYAEEGARLILVARTVGGLEEVDDHVQSVGAKATLVPMDLAEHSLIDQLGASIFERFGKLDVMVANAGHLGTLSPVAHGNPTMWQQVLNVNLLANQRLVRSMDPLLRASSHASAIFVTAPQGGEPKPFWSAYAVSKAGLEMMVRMYAAEVAKSGIRVNLIDPGKVSTSLRGHAFPGEREDAHPIGKSLMDRFVELAARDCPYHGARIAFEDKIDGTASNGAILAASAARSDA